MISFLIGCVRDYSFLIDQAWTSYFPPRWSTVSQCKLLSAHRKWFRLRLTVRLILVGLIVRLYWIYARFVGCA